MAEHEHEDDLEDLMSRSLSPEKREHRWRLIVDHTRAMARGAESANEAGHREIVGSLLGRLHGPAWGRTVSEITQEVIAADQPAESERPS